MRDLLRELRRPVVLIPAAVLLVLLGILAATRGDMEELAFLRRGSSAENGPVDQRPAQTAETLAGLAVSAEEQRFAQDAERLAEHEVDESFQVALRQAALELRTPTGAALELAGHLEELKAAVKADQAQVDALTAKTAATGAISDASAGAGDEVEIAKAQLLLDTDQLTDATADLAQATGDRRGEIEQELIARRLMLSKHQETGGAKASAATAVRQFRTLSGRATAWFAQRNREQLLQEAHDEALKHAGETQAVHAGMERKMDGDSGLTAGMASNDRVRVLKTMASERSMMTMLDDASETSHELADIYSRWQTQVRLQHKLVGHLLLESVAWVMAMVLVMAILSVLGRRLVPRLIHEPRQARTLETIVTLFVEIGGGIVVLLIVFGVPAQITTVIGLATAGFAVVFQDFFLAFFGWFVLMGRDGIRVNDWVEVGGVGGEVAEIGLFRTVLLETGNWTAQGHPTGRRITLMNSFAIRGQYFNFSTHGQWMWDEIKLNLPAEPRVYELVRQMHDAICEVTAGDVAQANKEWSAVSQQAGMAQFSADPTIDLRPAALGVDVVVRFVTRANERFEVGKRIYETLVKLMQDSVVSALPAEGVQAALES